MNDIAITLPSLAEQINIEHAAAEKHARTALDHALRAGDLLIQVKSQIGHGEWISWLEARCSVSPRSAQRYMRLALNREALEAKYDTVSHLPMREALKMLAKSTASESLVPAPGRAITFWVDAPVQGKTLVNISPSTNTGFYWVVCLYEEAEEAQWLKRPVRADAIGQYLDYCDVPHKGVEFASYPCLPLEESIPASVGIVE